MLGEESPRPLVSVHSWSQDVDHDESLVEWFGDQTIVGLLRPETGPGAGQMGDKTRCMTEG
jgi:hypothetical protein